MSDNLPQRHSTPLTSPNIVALFFSTRTRLTRFALVSWVHDPAYVDTESYEGDQVLLEFTARPAIIEQARSKAAALTPVESA